jgi:Protein of unknown function (DUF 659)
MCGGESEGGQDSGRLHGWMEEAIRCRGSPSCDHEPLASRRRLCFLESELLLCFTTSMMRLFVCFMHCHSQCILTCSAMQITNAEGNVKTAEWIKQLCVDIISEVTEATGASVAGFVMDSASANRSALAKLEADPELGPLVNLPCVAHTLSLLLKDISKHLQWVTDVYDIGVKISTCCSNSDAVKHLLKTELAEKGEHLSLNRVAD